MRLLKRKVKKLEGCGKLELERIIGLTSTLASGLSCNSTTGELAYLAGAVVVIYNVKSNCQTRFLMAPKSAKAFTCIAYSNQGGRLLAAGESGHQPGIIVWEVSMGTCVAELRTHKHGVCCVQFSPNGKHLVSVGVPSDGHVCLWDWKSGTLLAKSRASTTSQPACALQFASDGSFFVTGGIKHLKHWVIGLPKARSVGGNGTIGMEGKSIKLGSQKDSSFVAIMSAPQLKDVTTMTLDFQPLYALSAAGILCLLHCGLAIEKWVDLKVRHGYALAISDAHVGCACSDGIVRVFMHGSLTYAITLPRPAPYGYHGLTDANVGATLAIGNRIQPGIRYPDAIACSFLQDGHALAVIYGDHSLLVWNVQSFSKIERYRTLLSHNSCIWDVSLLPTQKQVPALQLINEKDCPPSGAFATCSTDGSIRLWNLGSGYEKFSVGLNPTSPRPPNIYNKDILGVLYIENRGDQKDKNVICMTNEELVDSLHGFRTICASPDGQHLATGDRNGNLRIYDLNTLQLISFKEVHNGELLSLSFTSNTNDNLVEEPVCIPLLASGGRDHLIHVYDVNRGYDVVETLDDHSASVTTVKFACSGSKLLSCSADKTVVFRNVLASDAGCQSSRYHQELSPRGTFYDIDTDPCDKFAVAVGQDKKLSILNLASGKTVRYLKPEGDVGEPFKVRLDPSGMYVVCSHSDRVLRVYDFLNGELLAYASGHTEIVTGMIFLPDCRRLVSVSGDSCIFIWRLPLNMSRCMKKRCIANAESQPPPRCLKFAPIQSPRHLDRTISIPRRVDHTIPFDPLDVKTKEADYNNQKDSSGKIKHGQVITPSVTVNNSNYKAIDRPYTEPGKSKKRFGCNGYRALSEARIEAVHLVDSFNICNYLTKDLDINVPQNTLGSRALQPEGNPLLSVQDDMRRESHWKTMHTVFFGENDYSHKESLLKESPQENVTCDNDKRNKACNDDASFNTMNAQFSILQENFFKKSSLDMKKNLKAMSNFEDEDGIITDLLDVGVDSKTQKSVFALEKTKSIDDEGKKSQWACEDMKSGQERFSVSSTRGESLEIIDNFNQETLDCHVQPIQIKKTSKQDLKTNAEFKQIPTLEKPKISKDTKFIKVNDDGVHDYDVQTRKDQFNGCFHKLASNWKVEDSDNNSFSTRFFTQSNSFHPQSPWFDTSLKTEREIAGIETQTLSQDEDLENNPKQLLVAERERLKLRERQDKMAIEVQRMRARLVNLGIAVAEIAHDGESTEHNWDAQDKFFGYSLPLESPKKPSALVALVAAKFEDSCLPNPPSEPSRSAQYGAKTASNFCLQDRIADGNESLCSSIVIKKNGNVLSTCESYNLDGTTPCIMKIPQTPLGTHNLRDLDGQKIDLWQIKARKEREGQNILTVEEENEEEISLVALNPSVKQDENPFDKHGSRVEDPLICRLIKIPSTAEVGRVLASRGERNAAEQGLILQEHNPCNRAVGPNAKSLESEFAKKKEFEIVTNYKDTISSIAIVSPTFGRILKSRENILPNFEEGNLDEEQRPDGHHSNTKSKVDNHASLTPSCTIPTYKDSLSSAIPCEASKLERREMSHDHEETNFQGDSQLIQTQRLFERCKSVNMNEFLGEIPSIEARNQLLCSSLEPIGEEPCISIPSLPRPVEDYQKSLYDLMEAVDRASLLFGEVRSVCRRTSPMPFEAPCSPSTSISLDILSLNRTYQRLLPGTLQTVQRLADEAVACGLPYNRAVMSVDNDSLNSFSPSIDLISSSATNSSMFQSRPGTSTSSSLASVDVEGFISRFSETLASQVLALVHKALPSKQT